MRWAPGRFRQSLREQWSRRKRKVSLCWFWVHDGIKLIKSWGFEFLFSTKKIGFGLPVTFELRDGSGSLCNVDCGKSSQKLVLPTGNLNHAFTKSSADLILRILEDAKEFDTRIWIAAVAIGKLPTPPPLPTLLIPYCISGKCSLLESIKSQWESESSAARLKKFNVLSFLFILLLVLGTLVILTFGTCLVLYKECQEYSGKPNLCLLLNALAFVLILCIVFCI